MQVLRLLAARRPVSTITAAASLPEHSSQVHDSEEAEEDEGPFFDLDLSSSSVRRASSSSSDFSSEDDLDDCFIISLHHRSRSASPSLHQFCASDEPSAKACLVQSQYNKRSSTNLRTLSFGAKKKKQAAAAAAAFYGGRPSFASSTRSLRLFMEESPADDDEDCSEPTTNTKRGGAPSMSIRRYLTNISRRLRSVRPRSAAPGDTRGLIHRRLRKSRSASAAVTLAPSSRRDDSLVEKQDGIASAIAHCKESFHRASLSECDSSLLRSRSDPGKCEASS